MRSTGTTKFSHFFENSGQGLKLEVKNRHFAQKSFFFSCNFIPFVFSDSSDETEIYDHKKIRANRKMYKSFDPKHFWNQDETNRFATKVTPSVLKQWNANNGTFNAVF